jgi:tetratricopeptide (TPR) repeat protein
MKKLFSAAIFLGLFSAYFAEANENAPSALSDGSKVVQNAEEKNLADEETNENSSSLKEPNTRSALFEVLKQQVKHQAWDLSRTLADKIVSDAPVGSREAYDALLLMARHAAAQSKHSESILYYERWRVMITQPDDQDVNMPQVLLELGREYRSLGAMKSAIDSFYRAMSVARRMQAGPSSVLKASQFEVAETTYSLQDWDRARRLFEMFTETYPDEEDNISQSAFYRIGDCYKALEDDSQTAINYQRALAHNSKHPMALEARMGLMEVFLKRENYPQVLQTLNELAASVTNMSPAEVLYWKRRSGELIFRYLFQNRSYESAYGILDALSKMDASTDWQDQIARWKALVHMGEEHWDKAIESFPKVKPLAAGVIKKSNPSSPSSNLPSETDAKYAEICKWLLSIQKKEDELQLPKAP